MELSNARLIRYVAAFSLAGLLFVPAWMTSLHAGFTGGNRGVGGVMIDSSGVVRTATLAEKQEFINVIRAGVQGAQGDLDQATDMRMISLSKLQNAIATVRQSGARLPESIRYMAGLTRIEYVFVDQENNDIILGGPAEPWKVADDGTIVGTKTGSATMHLEDLIVALRSVETARNGGISCSIEPTAEGRQRLSHFISKIQLRPGQNPKALESSMKQAFGPQQVLLTGIPTGSRYAATLVAADYEMKRLAMDLADSPIRGFPSYLSMSRNAAHSATKNPRWWMECSYDSLVRNEQGTAWKLSGQGVKTLTQDDEVDADGKVRDTQSKNRLAEKWATKMTENFSELARKVPIFGDVQNLMDLTVVATLIVQERLEDKAAMELTVLRDPKDLEPISYDAPETVAPECSFIKGRSGWVVTASGGVSVNAFEVVSKNTVDGSVAPTKLAALAARESVRDEAQWWWNR